MASQKMTASSDAATSDASKPPSSRSSSTTEDTSTGDPSDTTPPSDALTMDRMRKALEKLNEQYMKTQIELDQRNDELMRLKQPALITSAAASSPSVSVSLGSSSGRGVFSSAGGAGGSISKWRSKLQDKMQKLNEATLLPGPKPPSGSLSSSGHHTSTSMGQSSKESDSASSTVDSAGGTAGSTGKIPLMIREGASPFGAFRKDAKESDLNHDPSFMRVEKVKYQRLQADNEALKQEKRDLSHLVETLVDDKEGLSKERNALMVRNSELTAQIERLKEQSLRDAEKFEEFLEKHAQSASATAAAAAAVHPPPSRPSPIPPHSSASSVSSASAIGDSAGAKAAPSSSSSSSLSSVKSRKTSPYLDTSLSSEDEKTKDHNNNHSEEQQKKKKKMKEEQRKSEETAAELSILKESLLKALEEREGYKKMCEDASLDWQDKVDAIISERNSLKRKVQSLQNELFAMKTSHSSSVLKSTTAAASAAAASTAASHSSASIPPPPPRSQPSSMIPKPPPGPPLLAVTGGDEIVSSSVRELRRDLMNQKKRYETEMQRLNKEIDRLRSELKHSKEQLLSLTSGGGGSHSGSLTSSMSSHSMITIKGGTDYQLLVNSLTDELSQKTEIIKALKRSQQMLGQQLMDLQKRNME